MGQSASPIEPFLACANSLDAQDWTGTCAQTEITVLLQAINTPICTFPPKRANYQYVIAVGHATSCEPDTQRSGRTINPRGHSLVAHFHRKDTITGEGNTCQPLNNRDCVDEITTWPVLVQEEHPPVPRSVSHGEWSRLS